MSSGASHEDLTRSHEAKRGSERSFGVVFALVFTVVGCMPLWKGGSARLWALYAALGLALVALAVPKILMPFNRAWLFFGRVLSSITTPIILGIMYFVVVVPTGLLMRLFGRDSLQRGFDPDSDTYWVDRDPPGPEPGTMNVQF